MTALAAPAALLPEILPAAPVASPLSDVASLFGRFAACVDVAPKTVEGYARAIRQFGRWLASRGIGRPTADDVRDYREAMKADHKPGTVRTYLLAVKAFFSWTEEEGLYPNVAAKVKAGRIDPSPKKDSLTAGEARAVLAAAAGGRGEAELRDFALLALLFTSGLRAVEARRLDVADLTARGGVAGLYVQGKGHDSKDSFVAVQPEAEAAIRLYLAARGPVAPDAPLFASTSNNSRGGRLSTVSISCTVKAAFRRAGIDSPRKTCHSTRHTAVTLALLAGLPVREVSRFVRHASTSTTEIYAHDLDCLSNRSGAAIARQIF